MMGSAVQKVNDTNDASAAQERNREERFKTIFGQFVEKLKSRVAARILRHDDRLPMFGDPARNTLSQLQLQTPNRFRMGVLGSPQYEFISLQDVDEARVAPHHRRGKLDHVFQDVTKRERRGHLADYTVHLSQVEGFPRKCTRLTQANQLKRRTVQRQ